MHFLTLDRGDPARRAAENLIGDVYARAYGARIVSFPDRLVALADAQGNTLCAAGLRVGWQTCFSGCYLDEPVERILRRRFGHGVAPERILEVTTLAGIGHGHALRLIERIVETARGLSMHCGVFTATAVLRRALRRSGFPVVELVPALRERVADPALWGSYYDADPRVCALEDGPSRGYAARLPRPVLALEAPLHA